jgi:putative peptidoglycan lipid II flippase|tara:strand:+ start:6778 stop:8304 length:1527 start_codon:yes stop_codon:yes gene_type:complete
VSIFKSKHVAKGSVLIGAQNIIEFAVAFGFFFFLARIVTEAEVGQLSLLAFVMTIFTTLTQLSFPVAITKYVSEMVDNEERSNAGAVFRTGLKLILAVSIPSLIFGLTLSPFLSEVVLDGISLNTLIVVFLASFILDIAVIYGHGLLGLGLYGKMITTSLSYVVVSRSLGLVLASIGLGLFGIVLGWLIGASVSLIISVALLGRRLYSTEKFSSRKLIFYSLPVLLYSTIFMFQNWSDVIILYAVNADISEIGVYYLVVNGARMPSFIWVAICSALFPALSSYHGKRGLAGLKYPIFRAIRLLNLVVIPMGVVLAVVSVTGLEVAFGTSYRAGAMAFSLLTVTMVLPAYALLIITIFQSIGKTKPLIVIGSLSVIAQLITVAILAPTLGATGGAISRVIMNLVGVLIGYYYVRHWVSLPFLTELPKSFLLGLIIGIPLFLVEVYTTWINPQLLIIRVTADLIVFIIMAFISYRLLRVFTEDDFNLLRSVVPSQLHFFVNHVARMLVKS